MKADTPVEKLKNSFSTGACKTLRVSHSFHRLDDNEPKTTKPDTSLATETGHFHLLLTGDYRDDGLGLTPKIPKPLQTFHKIMTESQNNGVCANNEVFGRSVPPKTFFFFTGG